jgi:hypothetical protein
MALWDFSFGGGLFTTSGEFIPTLDEDFVIQPVLKISLTKLLLLLLKSKIIILKTFLRWIKVSRIGAGVPTDPEQSM